MLPPARHHFSVFESIISDMFLDDALAAKTHPRHTQDTPKTHTRHTQDTAKTQPRHTQDTAHKVDGRCESMGAREVPEVGVKYLLLSSKINTRTLIPNPHS